MQRGLLLKLTLGFLVLFLSAPLFSQEDRGTITGLVTDPQGAPVPGAAITATNVATGVVNKTKSDATGNYVVLFLPYGTYRVTAEAKGFATLVNPDVVLHSQVTQRVDCRLQVGSVKEVVSVTAVAPLLQTGDTAIQGNFTASFMEALPLGNNASGVITLMPGYSPTNNFYGAALSGSLGGVAPSSDGLRDSMGGYTVDGANITSGMYSYPVINPMEGGVEEVNVQTSNYPAENGATMGVHVNYTLKSGTNRYHGVAYDYLQNSDLDARNFFAPSVPPSKSNTFGAELGGPIKKNKLFFYGSYQGGRARSYSYVPEEVPTAAERSGDLNGLGNFVDPTTGQPFNGNQIPQGRFTATALAVLSITPPPNFPGSVYNWQQDVALPGRNDTGMGKIDYVISDNDRLSGHLYTLRANSYGINPDDMPLAETVSPSKSYSVALNETHTFSPTAILSSTAAWNRVSDISVYADNPVNVNTRSLFDMTIPSSIGPGDVMNVYPQFSITGFTAIGQLGNVPTYQYDENYEIAQDLALARGKHSIKMGYDLQRYRTGRFVNESTNGELSYGPSNPAPGSGNAFADFLLGLPNASNIDTNPLTIDIRHEILSFFIADKWRATRKLSFDVGIRWEGDMPPNEHWGRMSSFNLAPPGQFNLMTPGEALWNADYRNWAPRVGLTYQLNSKTVIRAAYGTYYSYPAMLFFVLQGANPPEVETYSFSPSPGVPLLDSNPFPIGEAQAGGVISPAGWQNTEKTPRVFSWDFDVQHSFTPNLLLDVGYMGNRAADLIDSLWLNVPQPGIPCPISGPVPGCRPLENIQPLRPLPNWSTDVQWTPYGYSTYEGLQVRVEKRFSHGFAIWGTFHWSKSMDIGSNETLNNSYWPNAPNLEYGPSDLDTPDILNIAYVYHLPVGRGEHWAPSNRVVDGFIGGWRLSGITTEQSGPALDIAGYSEYLDDFGLPQLPDRLCNGNLSHRTIQEWYNPACFGSPVPPNLQSIYNYGFQGNVARGILRGPHFRSWNMGLMKNFSIYKEQQLQFRAEFYNIFNQVNWGGPGTLVGPGVNNAGIIASAGPPRTMQVALSYSF